MAVLLISGIAHKNPGILRDIPVLRRWLWRFASDLGMRPISQGVEPYGHWTGSAPSLITFTGDYEPHPVGGVSSTVFIELEESALTVHTYPEDDYIEFNLHTCAAIPDVKGATKRIIEDFGLEMRYFNYVQPFNAGELAKQAYEPERWPDWLKEVTSVAR